MLGADRLLTVVLLPSRSASPANTPSLWLLNPITPAEDRVLQLVRRGESNRSIAAALMLSPRTVETHVSSLLGKTGCHSRSQLLLWAQRERPFPPSQALNQP